MDELIWSAVENTSEVFENGASSGSVASYSTFAPLTTPKSPLKQTVNPAIVAAVGLLICSVGTCANSVVLAVLVRARRQFGSSVHTLITNQSLMDLLASISGMATLIVMITHGYKYGGNRLADGAICMIFEDR